MQPSRPPARPAPRSPISAPWLRWLIGVALVLGLILLIVPTSSQAPAGAPARKGWQRVATENFNSYRTERWNKFEGRPGCCPRTVWDPDRVWVRKGVLTLANHPDARGVWRSGGIGAWAWRAAQRRYGRWDARIRFDRGAGVSGTALLWPGRGWPPEINYFEVFETWGERHRVMTTAHFGTAVRHRVDQRITRANLTRWHVFSVRWAPRALKFAVDGRIVHVVRNRKAIPDRVMWPGFQTHVHPLRNGRMPSLPKGKSSVRMQVDWMRVYKRV